MTAMHTSARPRNAQADQALPLAPGRPRLDQRGDSETAPARDAGPSATPADAPNL